MSKVMLSESYLDDIADAIRAKNGLTDTYKPSEMAEAISELGGATLGSKTITENDTYYASSDDLDGYFSVTVNVPNPSTGTISITSNGTVDVTQYASADVNVPSVTPTGTINITQNGTTDVTNYATANVNVPNPSTGTKQISITQNGTTTEDVTNYANAQITANVPNSYSAGDEGKVVSNGALVAQTSDTVTANDTYDTTLINSLTVNVSGGGGFSASEIAKRAIAGSITIDINSAGIGMYAFYECPLITAVTIKSCNVVYASAFERCTGVTVVDYVPQNQFFSRNNILKNCSSLNTLVLRKTSISYMSNVNTLSGTPFASGGTGGTIYIPESLYNHLGDGTSSDYKAATNWSIYEGYGTITWAKIEGSQYENYYADGTLIPTS